MKYSVIMAAHRNDDYLLMAVESAEKAIADDNAELIIIANGQKAADIHSLLSNKQRSKKTSIFCTEIPSLIYALNFGLHNAKGDYIARIDSDDLCGLERFKSQYNYAKRSNIDFLFSHAALIDANGNELGTIKESRINLWNICELIHPTAFIRRSALIELGGYGNLEFSEDYHLWLRAKSQNYSFAVQPIPLIQYRVHQLQATSSTKIFDTFATNVGIKFLLGLRTFSLPLFAGAMIDFARALYSKYVSYFR